MDNKIKILVFHHSGAIGGGGVAMLNILKALKSPNREIKVICPNEPMHMTNEITKLGIKVSSQFDKRWVYPHYNGGYYSIVDPRYQKGWSYIKSSFDTVRKLIEDENPDIVMLNTMTISWMVDCIDKNIKTICFDRETLAKHGKGIRNNRIKRWLHAMTKSVFLSQFDKKNAGSAHNSTVITDKVDMPRFDAIMERHEAREVLGLPADRRYILYVGGMWKLKGSHVALEAMHYLDEGYGLIFLQYTLGNRQMGTRDKLKKLIGKDYEGDTLKLLGGIEDKVFFFPPQKDMVPFYSASDVVIFPSTQPHQAIPVYEAGASYRPVVISDFENTSEYAKDGVNALTFKPGDAKKLAECIKRLEDDMLYQELSNNGRTMCEQEHNMKDLAGELQNLLNDIEDKK